MKRIILSTFLFFVLSNSYAQDPSIENGFGLGQYGYLEYDSDGASTFASLNRGSHTDVKSLGARWWVDDHNGNTKEFENDIAITPLGIPLICGPGAITVTMILVEGTDGWVQKGLLFGVILFINVIIYLSLIFSKKILKFFGASATKVMTRIMGLIIMVIGVEIFFEGLQMFLRKILKI